VPLKKILKKIFQKESVPLCHQLTGLIFMEQMKNNMSSTFRKCSDCNSIERMFEAMPGDIVLRPKPKPKTDK